jgi:hypothetical protein
MTYSPVTLPPHPTMPARVRSLAPSTRACTRCRGSACDQDFVNDHLFGESKRPPETWRRHCGPPEKRPSPVVRHRITPEMDCQAIIFRDYFSLHAGSAWAARAFARASGKPRWARFGRPHEVILSRRDWELRCKGLAGRSVTTGRDDWKEENRSQKRLEAPTRADVCRDRLDWNWRHRAPAVGVPGCRSNGLASPPAPLRDRA